MQTSVVTLLAFAFVLGVLVFVHELGHFLAAKRVGIRVLKFQLGFNPTILSVRRGDTEYSIGLLPLGGYVKMAGDSPDGERDGPPRRVPVEDQVGTVSGADHGAGDEPAAGRDRPGVRAAPGRRRAGLSGSAAGGRRRHGPDRPPPRATFSRATGFSRSPAATSIPGSSCSSRSERVPTGKSRSCFSATAVRSSAR